MKLILALLAVATFSLPANADILTAISTSSWPIKQTDKYKLDMYGYDARAYEFKTNNGMKCVAVFPGGSAVGWQMQCLPV